ncbi:MAG: arsenosugar biosynthesis radical SAM protein ArsS [Planctomycetes bacterium]|nr:arsenosugar biosynthesis radical SAM protein ArsS [Planctomycetota bacterium]
MILDILGDTSELSFEDRLAAHGISELRAIEVSTLQVNLGKRCNQACRHCHVDAGPSRTEEMSLETVEMVLDVLRRHPIGTLDITGGAPEINEHFRHLAREAAAYCERVIDRSNLTIFFEPGHEELPEFLAEHGIEITASLPCYQMENVDKQRGAGVFDASIRALQKLNSLGYGRVETGLVLNLVYNPIGAHLPPPQDALERDYKHELAERFGIRFNRLYTITNMPINRFRDDLKRNGGLGDYMGTLGSAFNPATIPVLMCRQLVSVSWDGYLYDCDFNQMLDMKVNHGLPNHIRDFDHFLLSKRMIRTASHCFGCTAGAGSSCSGVVAS